MPSQLNYRDCPCCLAAYGLSLEWEYDPARCVWLYHMWCGVCKADLYKKVEDLSGLHPRPQRVHNMVRDAMYRTMWNRQEPTQSAPQSLPKEYGAW